MNITNIPPRTFVVMRDDRENVVTVQADSHRDAMSARLAMARKHDGSIHPACYADYTVIGLAPSRFILQAQRFTVERPEPAEQFVIKPA